MVDFPDPDRPVNHRMHGLWCLMRGALALVDGESLVMDVIGAAQAVKDHAGGDGLIGVAIDQDKGAGVAVDLIGVESDLRAVAILQYADFVKRQRLGGKRFERGDVQLVFERGHGGRGHAVADRRI